MTGRFISVDPLTYQYPWNGAHNFAEDRVIDGKDLEGKEYMPFNPGADLLFGWVFDFVNRVQNVRNGAVQTARGTQTKQGNGADHIPVGPSATVRGTMQPATGVAKMAQGVAQMEVASANGIMTVAGVADGAGTAVDATADILAEIGLDFTRGFSQLNASTRLVRVIPEDVAGGPNLGRAGDPEVFVRTPDHIEGSDATGISKKLTLQNADGSAVQGPFRLIEFDAPPQGAKPPLSSSKPGFVPGCKTAGGANEYVVPNAKVSDLKKVTQTKVE